jgi:Alkylmercury lyase
MANLVIKTADELVATEVESRWRARRAARETLVSRRVLRAFVDRGGPIPVGQIVADLPAEPARAVRHALARLDDDDLIRIAGDRITVAYPFSTSPTAFVIRLPDGEQRYACCAVDALGISPMIGQPVQVRSRCHHCAAALTFEVAPQGPEREAADIMLWIGRRVEERCKVIDSL